jgi:hypothetical protein
MRSRRAALKAAASTVTALPILNAQHRHPDSSSQPPAYKPKWATAQEMKLLAAICEMIIPRTDTPGAAAARVEEYVEFHVASDEQRRAALREGLRWFAGVKPSDRVSALTSASSKPESKKGRFFQVIKDLTIDGYYSSLEGLAGELGWKGNTYLPEFKGCTHPEHQG